MMMTVAPSPHVNHGTNVLHDTWTTPHRYHERMLNRLHHVVTNHYISLQIAFRRQPRRSRLTFIGA